MKRKITMYSSQTASIQERFQQFLSAASANGFSERTLKMYRQHLHSISKHLDIAAPLSQLTKTDLEAMVESMRTAGLAHNSISSYLRVFKSFLSWCKDERYANVSAPSFRQKETVKDTYTDEELKRLLEKPKPDCSFCEYRNWVMIQFLLNSGCRASTIRNIQNRDVDLDSKQVIFRHTKTSKIQVIPLCSTLSLRLKEYMRVRAGEKSDYLFCTEHGEMMSEDALRNAIVRYNHRRGVEKTSIHMFRHTFARKYLLDCGGNAFTLQKLLGHSTLEMTKHYCAIYNADLANGFDTLSPLEAMSGGQKEKISKPKASKQKH